MKERIVQRMEKLAKLLNSPKGRIVRFYILILVFIMVTGWGCWNFIYNWPEVSKKYKPEEIPVSNEINATLPRYRYYLDFSPSMEGFIIPSGGMETLFNIFEYINTGKNGTSYFRCYDRVESCDASVFTNSDSMKKLYQQFVQDGMQDEVLNGIDLSKIFSSEGFENNSNNEDNRDNNNNSSNNTNNNSWVNIILTDLNFFDTIGGNSTHDERMDRFADGLSRVADGADICIYQFTKDYQGDGIDNVEFDDAKLDDAKLDDNPALKKSLLFLIVFSENSTAYEEYIQRLEMYLEQENMKDFHKMEFRNAFLQDNHFLQVDDSALYADTTSRINFHYNNEWIKNRESYEIGLYFSGENSSLASLQGNVVALNIEALGRGSTGEENNSVIDTKIKTLYPYGLSELREYNGTPPLKLVHARIVWDQNYRKHYLNIGIECDMGISFPKAPFLNKNYFVTEVQFFMERPDYKIPQWISELNTEETSLDLEKRRKIKELAQSLADRKANFFTNNAEDGEKYMGSLVFYISY